MNEENLTYFQRLQKIKLGQLPKEAVPKKKKYINKVGEKKKKELEEKKLNKGDTPLDKWFEERRKEMTGRCVLCNGSTLKNNDVEYRKSIHHLLDKRKNMFPSVATHPDNNLEVCFYGNSCHTNLHNKTITLELLKDSKEWDIIVTKFKKIYPFIKEEEKKNIPELLLNELK